MTAEQLFELPADGYRFELVGGEIVLNEDDILPGFRCVVRRLFPQEQPPQ